MSQTATRDDRRSALDEFATAPTREQAIQSLQSIAALQPAEAKMISGAQAVAVHRDEAAILQRIKVLAAAAGSDWYYRFPVKDKGKTSWIEGPSIKLANDLARLYGNCEVDCRAQDFGSTVLFHARFVDLESGYALTRPFQQRKGASKLGGSDEGRRDDITFQIGASKAIRNVVVNALQTFADFAFEEAKEALVEKIGRDIEKWRRNTVERISAKVDLKRVEAVVGRTPDKWLAPDIARIIAMGKACEDGMATWDETFPALAQAAEAAATEQQKLDQFASETIDTHAAAGPSASSDETPADNPSHDASAGVDRLAIITHVLTLVAGDKPVAEKLERLDVAMRDMVDEQPELEPFVKEATQTAARVAKGEITPAVARQWLENAK